MVNMNSYLSNVFPDPPMIAYRCHRNIKDFLIKAKVYGNKKKNERRILPGMQKCNKPCVTCHYILEEKLIKS